MDKSAIILIFNTAGQLALQLRSDNDDSYPLHWDFSAGGGIDDVESDETAASRELKEELGISTSLQYLGELTYLVPRKEEELVFFQGIHDGPFSPDPNEVKEVRFFSLQEVRGMVGKGEKFHPEFLFFMQSNLFKKLLK